MERQRTVESAWLITGPDDEPDQLMHARLEVDPHGVWWVCQDIGVTGEKARKDWATEEQARDHLRRVYEMGAEHGRWQVRQY